MRTIMNEKSVDALMHDMPLDIMERNCRFVPCRSYASSLNSFCLVLACNPVPQ